jgi:PTS system nitrogen regulatory IIA component
MELANLLSVECVLCDIAAQNKRDLLEKLSAKGEISGLKSKEIFDALLQRERLGTTGTGDGIAIPHSRFARLDRLYGFFARTAAPVEYESIDEKPVDLVFMLLAPETAGADHLKALAHVARLFRDKKTVTELRQAKSASALHDILTRSLPEASAA